MRCRVPTCGPTSDGEEATRPHPRYHKPNVFDPPVAPTPWYYLGILKLLFVLFKMKAVMAELCKSNFAWSLFKSVTLFTGGMKLIYDINDYMDQQCAMKNLCEEMRKNDPVFRSKYALGNPDEICS